MQVLRADDWRSVEDGIDDRESEHVRLGAGQDGAEQPRLAFAELRVYLSPERPGVGITNKNMVMMLLLCDLAQLRDQRHELGLGDCGWLGQTLRPTDQ